MRVQMNSRSAGRISIFLAWFLPAQSKTPHFDLGDEIAITTNKQSIHHQVKITHRDKVKVNWLRASNIVSRDDN